MELWDETVGQTEKVKILKRIFWMLRKNFNIDESHTVVHFMAKKSAIRTTSGKVERRRNTRGRYYHRMLDEADPEPENSEAKYDADNCEPAGIAIAAGPEKEKTRKTTWKKSRKL